LSPLWVWIEPYALLSFVGSLPIEDLHRLIVVIVIDTISVSIKPSSIALVPFVGIEQLNNQQTTPSAYSALHSFIYLFIFSRRSANTCP
jgi:Gpi18-like mannosyltransferase